MRVRNFAAQAILVSLSLVLAACGEGGGSVASTPTPTPTPAPTPTPSTPAATGPFPLTGSVTYSAAVASASYNGQIGDGISSPNTANLGESYFAPKQSVTSVAYDSATGTYSISDYRGSATLAPADRVTATGYFDQYRKQANGESDTLRLYGNVRSANRVAAAPVQLDYSSFAEWNHSSSDNTRRLYYTFGQATTPIAMPRTGSASYATTLLASKLSGLHVPVTQSEVTGTATFSADFAAGTVATSLQLSSSPSPYSGSGAISRDSFGGAFTSAAPDFTSGRFEGGFYGPNAREMGYIFTILHSNPDPFAGASPSPGLTIINGVVAGAASTPAPAPTSPPSLPIFPASGSVSMQHATAELAYRTDSSVGGGFSGTPSALLGFGVDVPGTRIVIGYNADSQTYTVRNEKSPSVTSASFGPADRVSSIEYVDRYSKQSGGVSDSLLTFGNARANASTDVPPVVLSYVSFGVWKHIESATATTTNSHFLFGWPTAPVSVPTTGTATYSLIVSGNEVASGPSFGTEQNEFGGSSIIRVNFAAGTLATELNLERSGILGSYLGTGTINGNVFNGSLDARLPDPTRPDAGPFSGGFFGPGASEIGYVFSITRTNPNFNAGASIGPRDIWLIGVAVGKKD